MQNITGLKKYLSGTTHYISEYILMLAALFGFAGSVILMVFSICNLLTAGDLAGLSVASGLSAVVGFLVFGVMYYVLSARVHAEESSRPEVTNHKARSVFLVLASVTAFGWFIGFMITSVYFLISPLVVKNASYSDDFVNVFLPALVAAVVVALAYVSIIKAAGTRYVAKFASIALLIGAVIAIVAVSVAVAKKDQKPTLKANEKCTFTNYDKGKCTYDDYQKYNKEQFPSLYDTSPTNKYNDYQYDNGLNSYN